MLMKYCHAPAASIRAHVDRARAPAEEHGGRAAGEVDARGNRGRGAEHAHEAPNPLGVRYFAHAAARSKLTSRRTSAL